MLASMCALLGVIAYLVLYPKLREAKEISESRIPMLTPATFTNLENTEVYDKYTHLIGKVNYSTFRYCSYQNISPYLIKGYIAVEDQRFYKHKGIDPKALLRAVKGLATGDESQGGGSTITQQVLKNNVLYDITDKFDRKMVELFLAPQAEKVFTKEQIMEFYCNTNFYHNNCYGVEAASQYYFGKACINLLPDEAAILIGLSNNPSKYNPVLKPDNCIEKRDQVLLKMYNNGAITETEYKESVARPLNIVQYRSPVSKENAMISFAIHSTTLELMKQQNFKFQYTFVDKKDYDTYTDKYNEMYYDIANTIRRGGYKIYTSFDPDIQSKLQEYVNNACSSFTTKAEDGRYAYQSSATLIDNSTGLVVAMVGSRNSDDEFNRAYQAYRQPGSSIKPVVVYTPAFDTGNYYPSKKVTLARGNSWYPKNWDGNYSGSLNIRDAISKSVNTIAFRIFQDITPEKGVSYLEKLQFTGLSYLDSDNASLAVGGFTYGTTSYEMAKAYYTIANKGVYKDTSCLIKVEYQGEVYYTLNFAQSEQVYEAESAYMAIDCMKGVLYNSNGTGKAFAPSNVTVAGKTGTTNNDYDAWFCGVSPRYTCAVWSGYDTPATIKNNGAGTTSGRVFKAIMEYVHQGKENIPFTVPSITYKYVNNNGDPVSYNSGKKDMFSNVLIEREAERKRQEAEKKEKERIANETASLQSDLQDFKLYTISSINDVYALDKTYKNLKTRATNIKNDSLLADIEDVYSVLSVKAKPYREQLARQQEEQREYLVSSAKNELSSLLAGYGSQSRTKSAIDKCKGYSEYKSLLAEYNEYISSQVVTSAPVASEQRVETTTAIQVETTTEVTTSAPVVVQQQPEEPKVEEETENVQMPDFGNMMGILSN
jgi:penicillin-binding protein 1A